MRHMSIAQLRDALERPLTVARVDLCHGACQMNWVKFYFKKNLLPAAWASYLAGLIQTRSYSGDISNSWIPGPSTSANQGAIKCY